MCKSHSVEKGRDGNLLCQRVGIETQRQLAKCQYLNNTEQDVPHTKVCADKKSYRQIPIDIVEQLRKG